MRRLRAWLLRILVALRMGRPEDDFAGELEAHVALHTEDGIRAGLSPEEARRHALLRLGGADQARQTYRERATAPWVEDLARDMRFALRQLSKARGFAIAAVLTLALGIGANTAVFSIVQAVLLRPLPYKNPDRLVVVWQADTEHRASGGWFDTYREFEAWQQSSRSFEKLAALSWGAGARTMLWHDKPIDVLPIPASVDFFSMLGVSAQIGRTFLSSDLKNSCTLVLAQSFWEHKLGAPREMIGQTIPLGDSPCQVVGVMAKGFSFYPRQTDAWTLITPASEFAQRPWEAQTGAFGLLKPGVTRAAAEAELAAIQARIMPEAPANLKSLLGSLASEPDVLDLKSNFTWLAGRNLRTGLWVLLGAAGLILLMACVNVANLLLGRAIERDREMAVRSALGSSRVRLFRQMLTEAAMLALAGATCGVLLAAALLAWFRAVNPVELPPGNEVALDWRVLLFSAAIGIAASLVFGVLPAWRSSRTDPVTSLRGGPNQTAYGPAQRAAQILVVVQVALSMVLLSETGLLIESLVKLTKTPLGYRTDHVLTAWVNLPGAHYLDAGARSRFAAALERKLSSLPGVRKVALGSSFTPTGISLFSIEGDARSANETHPDTVHVQDVSASYLPALEIPLLRGRFFDARDVEGTRPALIVNEALAKKYFGDSDPVGRAVKLSRVEDPAAPWMTIVGVVANVKTTTVFQEMRYVIEPAVYRPLTQTAPASLALMVVGDGSPLDLTSSVQGQLSLIDRGLILSDIETMQARLAVDLSQPRFRTVLAGGFAGLALALAIVGLYGVLSRMVVGRTREIGIRMALGANRELVQRSVVFHAVGITIVGICFGAAGAALVERVIGSLLYGIRRDGAGEFTAVAATILLVASVVALVPARRAASIDPMRALRME